MTDRTADTDERVSLLVRIDLRVEDAHELIDRARFAARMADPDLSVEQAEAAITTVDEALLAFTDAIGWDELVEDGPGVQVEAIASEVARGLDPVEFGESR